MFTYGRFMQKPTQHCKAIILQFTFFKKAEALSLGVSPGLFAVYSCPSNSAWVVIGIC